MKEKVILIRKDLGKAADSKITQKAKGKEKVLKADATIAEVIIIKETARKTLEKEEKETEGHWGNTRNQIGDNNLSKDPEEKSNHFRA